VRELRVPPLRSLAFLGDDLIDWLGGRRIASDGTVARFGVGDTYRFDSAIGLDEVGLLYEALGTKGLLVRWNRQLAARNLLPLGVDWIREVNRSFYQAEHYSFPACLLRLPNGRIALAHCPHEYNRLELELLDGTRLTQRSAKDRDFFHANLEVSPDGRFLLSNGWVWQPWSDVCVYDVARALAEPKHLSSAGIRLDKGRDWEWEVDAATFVGGRLVIATETDQRALAVIDLETGRCERLHWLAEPLGTRLMAFGERHVVALDGVPRLVSLETGAIVHRWDGVPGGPGRRRPSASMAPPVAPYVARDSARGRFAVAWPETPEASGDWRVVIVEGR
jgi:hypothetical protein